MSASSWLQRTWWAPRPSWPAMVLWPLEALYRLVLAARSVAYRRGWRTSGRAPVPVVVVGNVVVGGAGKTPTVIALVQALQESGRRPGVVSRGFGSGGTSPRPVHAGSGARDSGDEPLLMRARTRVPVWVGQDRLAAARALCAAHPDVDVIVSDDGLQHRALSRDIELVVFDDRGAGNGRLLPAGPLREPMPGQLAACARIVYNAAAPTTPLPGDLVRRSVRKAVPLHAWARGDEQGAVPLGALASPRLHAAAGIADPERFFAMLRAHGLALAAWALPDHFDFARLPWPDESIDVLVTEKDAVKLAQRAGGLPRVWVVPLDFELPAPLVRWVLQSLPPRHEP